MQEKEFYTIKEASIIMRCSVETVRAYIKEGIIKSQQAKPRGRHYIPRLEIPAYARGKIYKNNKKHANK